MNKYVLSGIVGGTFFAVPYLALNIGLLPSIGVGVLAFAASSLASEESDLDRLGKKNLGVYKALLIKNMEYVKELKRVAKSIADVGIRSEVNEITSTSEKIVNRLVKTPEKISQSTNFLNYYLPITLKILKKYEEIEEEKLTSKEVKDFKSRITNLLVNIRNAFDMQLNNLYSTDMVDIDAEMKVFEKVLKSDGLLGDVIKKESDKDEH
ncbi:MAG: 5-bromo-4-chloroindolyl phosphate hydrolysis family protein [Bacilli bacterium]|nr:5-bromo-4-chloroindolyl phosphate hydrolysis family protein [Bacilli bacterium]